MTSTGSAGGTRITRRKIAYGDHPAQYGHLYLPDRDSTAGRAPLVVLVHGGSWSTEFALVVYSAVARDLAARGAVVWNIEYRRREEGGDISPAHFVPGGGDISPAHFVPGGGDISPAHFFPGGGDISPAHFFPGGGDISPAHSVPGGGDISPAHSVPGGGDISPAHSVPGGGGWPQTGRDVVAAINALDGPVAGELASAGIAVDRRNVAVVGHSAGGQLAAWAVAQLGARTARHRISTVIPQSAVLDFTVPGARDKESVVAFLGASYDEAPARFADASPAHAPVVDATVAVVHTTGDQAVPLAMSEHYVEVMTARGQVTTLTEVPGEHSCFVNPKTPAHRATLRALGL